MGDCGKILVTGMSMSMASKSRSSPISCLTPVLVSSKEGGDYSLELVDLSTFEHTSRHGWNRHATLRRTRGLSTASASTNQPSPVFVCVREIMSAGVLCGCAFRKFFV